MLSLSFCPKLLKLIAIFFLPVSNFNLDHIAKDNTFRQWLQMGCCHKDITTIKGFLSPTIRSWGKFTAVQFWRQTTTTIICNFVTFLSSTCSKVSVVKSSQINTKFNSLCNVQLQYVSTFDTFEFFSFAAMLLHQKQIFSRESKTRKVKDFIKQHFTLISSFSGQIKIWTNDYGFFEGTRLKENSGRTWLHKLSHQGRHDNATTAATWWIPGSRMVLENQNHCLLNRESHSVGED